MSSESPEEIVARVLGDAYWELPPDALRRDLANLGDGELSANAQEHWTAAIQQLADVVSTFPGSMPSGDAVHAALIPIIDAARARDRHALDTAMSDLLTELEGWGLWYTARGFTIVSLRMADADDLQCGRLLARVARQCRTIGDTGVAVSLYDHLETLGVALPELRSRAELGFALLAQRRGNLPESNARFENALKVAENAGLAQLTVLAHQGLYANAAIVGDINEAFAHAWRSFLVARGDERTEGQLLADMGHLVTMAGHADRAVACFRLALERPLNPSVTLQSLAGLAMSAARLGDARALHDAVEWFSRIAVRVPDVYAFAASMMELRDAANILGQRELADSLAAKVRVLAERHQYHELMFRLELGVGTAPAAVALDDEVLGILERLPTEAVRVQNIALALLNGVVRVVAMEADGRWAFVDGYERYHGLVYVRSRFYDGLRSQIEELEALVNDVRTTEAQLQHFFERHADFVLTDDYERLHSKLILDADTEGTLIPDFVLEPVAPQSLCDVLELKLPEPAISVAKRNRERFAASVFEACAQLRRYRDYFDERLHRERFHSRYRLDAFRPRLFVVIGRRARLDPVEWRRIEGDLPGYSIRTYDDIIDRAKAKLHRINRWRAPF